MDINNLPIADLIELGQQIKRIRKRKGLSPEAVYELIYIKPLYIEAIEEGNFNAFRSIAYARGFVRNYLDFLGADDFWSDYDFLLVDVVTEVKPEVKLDEFPSPSSQMEMLAQDMAKEESKVAVWSARLAKSFLVMMLMLAFVVATVAGIYYAIKGGRFSPKPSSIAEAPVSVVTVQEQTPVLPEGEDPQIGLVTISNDNETVEIFFETESQDAVVSDEIIVVEEDAISQDPIIVRPTPVPPAVVARPVQDEPQVAATEEAVKVNNLTIRMSGPVRLRVVENGVIKTDRSLKNGDFRAYDIVNPLKVTVSNMAGAKFYLNDKEISMPQKTGSFEAVWQPDGSFK